MEPTLSNFKALYRENEKNKEEIERLSKRVEILEQAILKVIKAYYATGPDNGPSITEHEAVEECAKLVNIAVE